MSKYYTIPSMFLKLVILTIFLMSHFVMAQSGTIVGSISDEESSEPLIGANVFIEGTSFGAATDIDGQFYIPNIPAGEYNLKAAYVGYQSKSLTVQVDADETVKLDIILSAEAIEGEVIEVTAQAKQQLMAINKQLTSNRIVNIVSGEKMRELPDANAAESIGRLPGISLQRSAGEANKIVVRGLSPKYNVVNVEGVRMASTNDWDRSVDLSLIQGEMLDGVEVMKTLRPDMDADAIGGTINLRLKTADTGLKFNLRAEGGYTDLSSDWNNYKFVGSVSDRFWSDKIGARLELVLEQKNMPSDNFGGNYSGAQIQDTSRVWKIYTNSAVLTDRKMDRGRYGGSLIMDYDSDWWTVKLYNMYNRKKDLVSARQNTYQFNFSYNPEKFRKVLSEDEWTTDIRTHTLQNEFRFDLLGIKKTKLNLDFSVTDAETKRAGEAFPFVDVDVFSYPQDQLQWKQPADLLKIFGQPSVSTAYLREFDFEDQHLTDESFDMKLDYTIPFHISNKITGTFTLGGKYNNLERDSDGLSRYSSFEWGGSVGRRNYLLSLYPWIETNLTTQRGIEASNFLDANYNPGTFLEGRYILPWGADLDLLKSMQDNYYNGPGDTKYYVRGLESHQRDYTTTEDLKAGYMMAEFNIGNNLMILPGVRFEHKETSYRSFHILTQSNQEGIAPNPDSITVQRENDQWFPSLNMKYRVTENAFFQGAIAKSTSRPDFRRLSPLLVISGTDQSARGYYPYVDPATAWNFDLGFSYHSNKIGLLAVNGFYKEIEGFIYTLNRYYPYRLENDQIVGAPAGLMNQLIGFEYYDPNWFDGSNKNRVVYNYAVNSPETAYVRGLEFSWQTNFWYLPSLLSGLTLDVNFSIISSNTLYPYFSETVVGIDSSGRRPVDIMGDKYETRSGKLIDQPESILNLILGWDYKGFSSRLSYRWQDQTLTGLDGLFEVRDTYYKPFTLIDLMLSQKIMDRFSVYANLTNIGNHIDDYIIHGTSGYKDLPTSSQHYGFRAQFGITASY